VEFEAHATPSNPNKEYWMLVLFKMIVPTDPDVMFSSILHVPDGRAEHSLTAASTASVITACWVDEREPEYT
jgi:hypothetical protein